MAVKITIERKTMSKYDNWFKIIIDSKYEDLKKFNIEHILYYLKNKYNAIIYRINPYYGNCTMAIHYYITDDVQKELSNNEQFLKYTDGMTRYGLKQDINMLYNLKYAKELDFKKLSFKNPKCFL